MSHSGVLQSFPTGSIHGKVQSVSSPVLPGKARPPMQVGSEVSFQPSQALSFSSSCICPPAADAPVCSHLPV